MAGEKEDGIVTSYDQIGREGDEIRTPEALNSSLNHQMEECTVTDLF